MLLITRYKHMLSLIRKTLNICTCMLIIPKLIVANSFFHLSLLNEIMLKECQAQIIMLNVGKMVFAGMKKNTHKSTFTEIRPWTVWPRATFLRYKKYRVQICKCSEREHLKGQLLSAICKNNNFMKRKPASYLQETL